MCCFIYFCFFCLFILFVFNNNTLFKDYDNSNICSTVDSTKYSTATNIDTFGLD